MSKVNAIPNGMHTVTPHLICAGAGVLQEGVQRH